MRGVGDGGGRRLVRVVCRGSGSVVIWRRARVVLVSARGVAVSAVAGAGFASGGRVRDVAGGLDAGGVAVPGMRGRSPAGVRSGPAAGGREGRRVRAGRA